MKAKISVEQEFDEDVKSVIAEEDDNTPEKQKEELEEFLSQSLFEIAEDWVLRGVKPNITFLEEENQTKLEKMQETLTKLHDKIADKPHDDPIRILVETLEDQIMEP